MIHIFCKQGISNNDILVSQTHPNLDSLHDPDFDWKILSNNVVTNGKMLNSYYGERSAFLLLKVAICDCRCKNM